MKNTVLAIFFVMFLFEAISSPIEPKGEILHRFRRFTCDVLSIEAGTIKINHTACALHCVYLDYKGGYCNDKAVCVCRN